MRAGAAEVGVTDAGRAHDGLVTVPFRAQQLVAVFPPGSAAPAGSLRPGALADVPLILTPPGSSGRRLLEAARLAGERAVSVDWVQADLLDYQPAPGGYDLVLVAYIHLPAASLGRVFRAAGRLQVAGGYLRVRGRPVRRPRVRRAGGQR